MQFNNNNTFSKSIKCYKTQIKTANILTVISFNNHQEELVYHGFLFYVYFWEFC